MTRDSAFIPTSNNGAKQFMSFYQIMFSPIYFLKSVHSESVDVTYIENDHNFESTDDRATVF